MMQQVQNVMAAVEKFDMKIAPQAIAIGPSTGRVVCVRISRFFRGFLRQPRTVSAGSSGIRWMKRWRLASCCARIAISAMRRKSEGWNVTPITGIRIQRDALFRLTPIKKVSSMNSSAATNTRASSRGRA